MTDLDRLARAQAQACTRSSAEGRHRSMTKIVAGKQLWNYDNLEPTEKKLVL